TGAPTSVRSRAHEYGGGSFLPAGGRLFFSNNEDQQLYWIATGDAPQAPAHCLTTGVGMRYADAVFDAARQRLIAVREDHSGARHEPLNTIVSIDLATSGETILLSGYDFYASPCISPDGTQLAWLSWNHPNMPWDGTELWQVDIAADGSLCAPIQIAGGADVSIFQPSWSPDGELYFISDSSGWWNLYRHRNGQTTALHPMPAEFGQAQWVFGMSTYGFDGHGNIICSYSQNGTTHLAILDLHSGAFDEIATPFNDISDLQIGAGFAVFMGGSPTVPESVIRLDMGTLTCRVLRSSSTLTVDEADLSVPEAVEFPTEGGLTAHAFFYPPRNQHFHGPAGQRPPLLVLNHGGPTSMTTATLKLPIQYWTSRGFAVADINYGGSTGYGRSYRQRLRGLWGVVDVDDAVNATRFLIRRGDVNPEQVAIRGSSAGGYTALSALTFRRAFKAGASYYGVGDLALLAADTHKFESHYLDSLVGPYPEQKQLYFDRSPINFTDKLESPLILFQGMQDKVVPPSQAQTMFDAVKAKGIPVAYLTFEQEQHGFRRAENIKRALDAELYFYGKIFGFVQADAVEAVTIENLTDG
ncbi:MAG: S9 family peptidase, partial [Burkholderiales bacterium]